MVLFAQLLLALLRFPDYESGGQPLRMGLPDMKLYFSPGACSLSPHIVLREIGQKFDLAKVDLGSKKTDAGEDYTKVNPKGYVPALEIKDGEVLTEGPAIVQYLADNAKATNIL